MMQPFFPRVDEWRLSSEAITTSFEELARDGLAGNEGVALWLGRRHEGRADVTHVVLLRGSRIIRRPDLIDIHASLFNDVADVGISLGIRLIGQIHSHGPQVGTDLSWTDRTRGLQVPFYLSVVAPDYGLRANGGLAGCGVHVFEAARGYRRLGVEEVSRRVQVVHDLAVSQLIVGKERP